MKTNYKKAALEFKGKLAVITGGASGIVRSSAIAMAELGANIKLLLIWTMSVKKKCARRQEIENIGQHALAVQCDVSKDADVENLKDQTISTMGVLINDHKNRERLN